VRRSTKSAVTLRVLGSGDAFGTGGRYHTCFLLDAPGSTLIIDCGASALVSMHRFGVDTRTIDAIVLSHLHGDHFGGLPFFLMDAAFVSRRTRPLVIAGPPGSEDRVRAASEVLFPGFWSYPKRYAIEFLELTDREPSVVSGATVTPFRVVHDSGALAFALRVEAGGCTVAYSGDTAWAESLIDAARDADLFLCEATSFDSPIPNHLTYKTIVKNRRRFGASRIVLTHLGPEVLRRRKNLALDLARDGQLFRLKRTKR